MENAEPTEEKEKPFKSKSSDGSWQWSSSAYKRTTTDSSRKGGGDTSLRPPAKEEAR